MTTLTSEATTDTGSQEDKKKSQSSKNTKTTVVKKEVVSVSTVGEVREALLRALLVGDDKKTNIINFTGRESHEEVFHQLFVVDPRQPQFQMEEGGGKKEAEYVDLMDKLKDAGAFEEKNVPGGPPNPNAFRDTKELLDFLEEDDDDSPMEIDAVDGRSPAIPSDLLNLLLPHHHGHGPLPSLDLEDVKELDLSGSGGPPLSTASSTSSPLVLIDGDVNARINHDCDNEGLLKPIIIPEEEDDVPCPSPTGVGEIEIGADLKTPLSPQDKALFDLYNCVPFIVKVPRLREKRPRPPKTAQNNNEGSGGGETPMVVGEAVPGVPPNEQKAATTSIAQTKETDKPQTPPGRTRIKARRTTTTTGEGEQSQSQVATTVIVKRWGQGPPVIVEEDRPKRKSSSSCGHQVDQWSSSCSSTSTVPLIIKGKQKHRNSVKEEEAEADAATSDKTCTTVVVVPEVMDVDDDDVPLVPPPEKDVDVLPLLRNNNNNNNSVVLVDPLLGLVPTTDIDLLGVESFQSFRSDQQFGGDVDILDIVLAPPPSNGLDVEIGTASSIDVVSVPASCDSNDQKKTKKESSNVLMMVPFVGSKEEENKKAKKKKMMSAGTEQLIGYSHSQPFSLPPPPPVPNRHIISDKASTSVVVPKSESKPDDSDTASYQDSSTDSSPLKVELPLTTPPLSPVVKRKKLSPSSPPPFSSSSPLSKRLARKEKKIRSSSSSSVGSRSVKVLKVEPESGSEEEDSDEFDEHSLSVLSKIVPQSTEVKEWLTRMEKELNRTEPNSSLLRDGLTVTREYREAFMKKDFYEIDHGLRLFPAFRNFKFLKWEFNEVYKYERKGSKHDGMGKLHVLQAKLDSEFRKDCVSKQRPGQKRHPIWQDAVDRLNDPKISPGLKRVLGIICLCFYLAENKVIENLFFMKENGQKLDWAKISTPRVVAGPNQFAVEKAKKMYIYAEGSRHVWVPNIYEGVLTVYSLYYIFNIEYNRFLKPIFKYFDNLLN